MCDGPPYMNRKITLFAFAGKCAGLGASGLALATSSARACGKKPSRVSRSIRPSEAKPEPACQRNSRRVRPQKLGRGFTVASLGSVQEEEFVEIQGEQGERLLGPLVAQAIALQPIDQVEAALHLGVLRIAARD